VYLRNQKSDHENVCVLGLGYVGLTLAVIMAESGFDVTGVEINPSTLSTLQSGKAHFYETGLTARLNRQLKLGRLYVTNDIREASKCQTFIITVGTPLDQSGFPQLGMVQRAAKEIASVMEDGSLIVLRSTVKVGTTRNIIQPVLHGSGKAFRLAYCPERTVEGRALEELRSLPQIVGGLGEEDVWRATDIFQRITPTTIRVSQLETAELIKLLDNSYRDLFFSFGNEVALLCDTLKLDAMEVINAANTGYERTNIAKPGLVGGPCLEKDPHILAFSLAPFGAKAQLISAGRALNESLPEYIAKCIVDASPLRPDARITICGLAFKGRPETNDLRGTPAKYVLNALKKVFPDATYYGQDYAVSEDALRGFGLEPVSIQDAFRDKDLVIIANNNVKYESLELDEMISTMARPGIVFDCWNVLPVSQFAIPDGVLYMSLGHLAAATSKEAYA
jgi:UDP-N-acetyl-D-mannosaminuronic acid dehydrogenase